MSAFLPLVAVIAAKRAVARRPKAERRPFDQRPHRLTMRRLAADFGVDAMSLYYQPPGPEGLLDDLVDGPVDGPVDGLVDEVVAEIEDEIAGFWP